MVSNEHKIMSKLLNSTHLLIKKKENQMNLKKIRPLYRKSDVSTGNYVLLAIEGEDRYNGGESRWITINPNKPIDKVTRTNCILHKPKKIKTRAWFRVVGTRDGIIVKTKLGTDQIYLNNVLDFAESRSEMITKRDRS